MIIERRQKLRRKTLREKLVTDEKDVKEEEKNNIKRESLIMDKEES